jgi:VIT1/CCC1 family predicted Fe2+/Mn2+ transporter
MNNNKKTFTQHAAAFAQNELTESIIYKKLAGIQKNLKNADILRQMAQEEHGHYEFWKSLSDNAKIIPRSGVYLIPLLCRILGVTFASKYLEGHEQSSVQTYQKMLAQVPENHRQRLLAIIEDEKGHEQSLLAQLQEKRVEYISFVALGLSDAIVEITGVHAGFLGVTGTPLIAGVAGVIVGVSAAISMGSAAYIQAKHEEERSAFVSALTTGFSYFGSVIVLALPYFFIHEMFRAFAVSTIFGLLLLAAFTYYGAIVFNRKFWRELSESAALMLGTAVVTFIVGHVVGGLFHIDTAKF